MSKICVCIMNIRGLVESATSRSADGCTPNDLESGMSSLANWDDSLLVDQ
jgi:hypothetical protein